MCANAMLLSTVEFVRKVYLRLRPKNLSFCWRSMLVLEGEADIRQEMTLRFFIRLRQPIVVGD